MPKYRLSEAARRDLMEIAEYGDKHWGVRQSDAYKDRLKQRFEVLVDSPFLYQSVDHIRESYRRCVCGVHSIYYQVGDDSVEIMRILRSQDPADKLY